MSFLLDTNIVSEVIKQTPHPQIISWLNSKNSMDFYISVITVGEIKRGISHLSESKKKIKIDNWFNHEFFRWFDNRILPIDLSISLKWGELLAQHSKTLPAIDSLLAATALSFDLTLITRNTKDFNIRGLRVLDPAE